MSDISIFHSLNSQTTYQNIHRHNNIPINQCKLESFKIIFVYLFSISYRINLENLKRCRICKFSYRTLCIHQNNIDELLRKIQMKNFNTISIKYLNYRQ